MEVSVEANTKEGYPNQTGYKGVPGDSQGKLRICLKLNEFIERLMNYLS